MPCKARLCHDRLSARPCVSLRYHDHIGWNTSKIISRLISLGSSLFGETASRGFHATALLSCYICGLQLVYLEQLERMVNKDKYKVLCEMHGVDRIKRWKQKTCTMKCRRLQSRTSRCWEHMARNCVTTWTFTGWFRRAMFLRKKLVSLYSMCVNCTIIVHYSVEMQLSQHQHQDSPLWSPGNVSLTLQRRNMDTSVGRCEDTGCIPYEMSATDTWHPVVATYL